MAFKELVAIFIRIQTKKYGVNIHHYAILVENKRVKGKVVQTAKAYLGPVTTEQIPYLKVAYARKKPRLVYDDE
jgi:predicted methyltransferase MtxX (methanogen marker protein 4)